VNSDETDEVARAARPPSQHSRAHCRVNVVTMRAWAGICVALAACEAAEVPRPTHEGRATILAWEQRGPRAVIADETGVTWSASDRVVTLGPGDSTPRVLASGLKFPVALCRTDVALYVATEGSAGFGGPQIPGEVLRVDGDGTRAIFKPTSFGPADIDCDRDGVYWSLFWTTLTPAGLFSGLMSLDPNGDPIFTLGEPYIGEYIAIDRDYLYWSVERSVMRSPRALPLAAEPVSTTTGWPTNLEISGELVWFVPSMNTGEPGTLFTATPGGTPRMLAEIDDRYLSLSIAIDAAYVYWSDPRSARVMRVAQTGGPPEVFADLQGGPGSIAIYDGAAFWTNSDTGTVVTLSTAEAAL